MREKTISTMTAVLEDMASQRCSKEVQVKTRHKKKMSSRRKTRNRGMKGAAVRLLFYFIDYFVYALK
jgi:hypothetical protein